MKVSDGIKSLAVLSLMGYALTAAHGQNGPVVSIGPTITGSIYWGFQTCSYSCNSVSASDYPGYSCLYCNYNCGVTGPQTVVTCC
jgi:hypothetical protein